MSTTNQPGAGPEWPADARRGSAPDDSGGGGGVDPEAIRRGHEKDVYDTASVVSVPLMVVGFFVLGFAVTTAIFWYVTSQGGDPEAHAAATARNAAPLNERLGRIHRGGEIDQPRLEPLVLREEGSTVFPRQPLRQGNSPQIHPEQIRVSRENTPALYESGWLDKGKVARIPIDEAMKIAAEKDVLKARVEEYRATPWRFLPTAANAGRGAGSSTVQPPKPAPKNGDPAKAEAPPPKKTDEKKPADKK
jgi:hypothetical protein